MRQQVCNVLEGTLNTWQYNLQAKWGDPRVYEMERMERLRDDARLAYDLSRRNTQLLSDAYEAQRNKNRERHANRMTKIRAPRGSKPPESSAAAPTVTRSFEPPPETTHAAQ